MLAVKVVALFLFLVLPGWALVSVLAAGTGMRRGERIWLILAAGTGLASLCASFLGYFSFFGRLSVLLTVGSISVLLAGTALFVGRRKKRSDKRLSGALRGGRGELPALLAVAVLGTALFAPPWRIVSGFSDVGIYPAMAANLVREGRWWVENRTAAEIPASHADLVFHAVDTGSGEVVYHENQFYAFQDLSRGREWPLFFHLWPSLMAFFAVFLGTGDMFWALTWVSVLVLTGLFLLSRRALGGRWAWVVVVLAAVCPLTLYFGRYTSSEMMNALLFLGGALCAWVHLQEEGEAAEPGSGASGASAGVYGTAALAGFFFSLGFLCRVDFIFLLVPLAVFLVLKGALRGLRGADWVLLATTALGAVLALVTGVIFSRFYLSRIWKGFTGGSSWTLGAGGAALALLLVWTAFFPARARRLARRAFRHRGVWTAVLWALVALLFAWLYFLRPLQPDRTVSYGFIKAVQGPSYRSQDFLRWAWYLSPLGLAALFAGYALALSRWRKPGELFLAACGLSFTVLYAVNMRALPLHILIMRRLVPVILPAGLVMIAATLKRLACTGYVGVGRGAMHWRPGDLGPADGGMEEAAAPFPYPARALSRGETPGEAVQAEEGAVKADTLEKGYSDGEKQREEKGSRRGKRMVSAAVWAARAAAAGAFLYLVAYMAHASMPLWGLKEGGNQWEAVQTVASRVPPGAVLFMDYHSGDHFGTPLRNFHGVENMWLKEETMFDPEGLCALLSDLGFPRREAYLLWRPSISGESLYLPRGVEAVEVLSFPVREYALERSFEHRPRERRNPLETYRLYRLQSVE